MTVLLSFVLFYSINLLVFLGRGETNYLIDVEFFHLSSLLFVLAHTDIRAFATVFRVVADHRIGAAINNIQAVMEGEMLGYFGAELRKSYERERLEGLLAGVWRCSPLLQYLIDTKLLFTIV
jgi:hypothetical protein